MPVGQVTELTLDLFGLFGIGAVYILMFNGIRIGATLAVCYKTNPAFGNQLVTFMIGHGVIEEGNRSFRSRREVGLPPFPALSEAPK